MDAPIIKIKFIALALFSASGTLKINKRIEWKEV
jgi:hypothetical protein